jgi:hypothetical protein
VNGQPTMFYSDFNASNSELEGVITVSSGAGDDDFIGFALGYRPDDPSNPAADFLLIDWKKSTQPFDFGSPSCTPSSTAPAGLALSRVRGIPTADEFWGHTNFNSSCSDLASGLEELARGATRGATGWQTGVAYRVRFEFTAAHVRIFVNDVEQISVAGQFADGRFAFYNFSQASVTYSGFTVENIGPVARCRDITVAAGEGCVAAAAIDDGSFDPEGGPVRLEQHPPGPYSLGQTTVTLTVRDQKELESQCTAVVTVLDEGDPAIQCPAPLVLRGPEGGIPADDPRITAFLAGASATDDCDPVLDITHDAPGNFPVGTTEVMFTATDDAGRFDRCSSSITIEPEPEKGVARLDLHPRSCPNPLNTDARGVYPAALLGGPDFDVRLVDVASLRLEGVPPLRSSIEDVTQPTAGELCECTTAGGDGHPDLTLKFSTPSLAAVIAPGAHREERRLTLTGLMLDGSRIEAQDCVVLLSSSKRAAETIGIRPLETALLSLAPQPMRGRSRLQYSIAITGPVRLQLVDVRGRIVCTLAGSEHVAGHHQLELDASGLASGMYFVRLESRGTVRMMEIVVTK